MTDCHKVRSNTPTTSLSNFLQVSLNGHMRRTVNPTTVRPAQPFWLLETLFPNFSKCPLTYIYDGTSYPRWSVLHNNHDGQRYLSLGSSYFFLSNPRWTLTTDHHYHDGPFCLTVTLVRDFPSGVSTLT